MAWWFCLWLLHRTPKQHLSVLWTEFCRTAKGRCEFETLSTKLMITTTWVYRQNFEDQYILKLQSISLGLLQLNHMQGWSHLKNLNMPQDNISINKSLLFPEVLIAGCSPLPPLQHLGFLFFLLLGSPLASKRNSRGREKIWRAVNI